MKRKFGEGLSLKPSELARYSISPVPTQVEEIYSHLLKRYLAVHETGVAADHHT